MNISLVSQHPFFLDERRWPWLISVAWYRTVLAIEVELEVELAEWPDIYSLRLIIYLKAA